MSKSDLKRLCAVDPVEMAEKRKMKSASIERSGRLQRVLAILSDGKPHTTLEIIQKSTVCAVNSIISELRDNGYKITCQRSGNKWYYWLDVR